MNILLGCQLNMHVPPKNLGFVLEVDVTDMIEVQEEIIGKTFPENFKNFIIRCLL